MLQVIQYHSFARSEFSVDCSVHVRLHEVMSLYSGFAIFRLELELESEAYSVILEVFE